MELKAAMTIHNIVPAPPSPLPPPPSPPPVTAHSHHHPLHMAFYWSKEAQFLFPGWPDNNTGMYVLSLMLVLFLAVLVEFLSSLNLLKPGSNRAGTIFFQTGIHAIRAGFVYMVILAVMSYNGGVFIAACLGHAVGYVVFRSGLKERI